MTGEEHHRLAEMLIASISEPSLVRSDYPMIRTDEAFAQVASAIVARVAG
jgi:hypothetical protein